HYLSHALAPSASSPLSLHDALPISEPLAASVDLTAYRLVQEGLTNAIKHARAKQAEVLVRYGDGHVELTITDDGSGGGGGESGGDRKSTRLNSSHDQISYAVFCLKK